LLEEEPKDDFKREKKNPNKKKVGGGRGAFGRL